MRERPELWTGHDRIQWGCALMRLLGESSLENLSVVLGGLRSVECSRQAEPFRTAIATARQILGDDLLTRRAVRAAVLDFQSEVEHGNSFRIDAASLSFEAVSEYDAAVTQAEAILLQGLPQARYGRELANTRHDLLARLEDGTWVPLRLNGLSFPSPHQHDLQRRPLGPIEVRWSELESLARDLDLEDASAGRREHWADRLAEAQLQVTTWQGLRDEDTLRLDGLTHLLGLPGAGKTTLITLLCVLFHRRGWRMAVFFTAIEVAREYLEKLARYGVATALLVGRAMDTHLRHASALAELVATAGNGGFGHERAGVELLAQSCALPVFADDWPDGWELGEAPCESIYESIGNIRTAKLCPAWSLCGRVRNQRDLVTASVWLGHILSADTRVPAHTSPERIRFFELVARTFDLVVVDEPDEAQRVLDEYGARILTLTGDAKSLHISLQRTTRLLAANDMPVTDAVVRYILRGNEFERHTLRFVREIRQLQKRQPRLAQAYAGNLLTASFLLREAVDAAGRDQDFSLLRQSALADLWESAMYKAFFERGRRRAEGAWARAPKLAGALGLSPQQGNQVWLRINRALGEYLEQDHAAAAEEPIRDVLEALAGLVGLKDPARIEPHVRLLIAVGFTIASYQRLAREARPLARRGEITQDLTYSRASTELRTLVPRSILGVFSAVRYRPTEAGSGLEIDYLVMDTTPRMLLHRLHEGGATNTHRARGANVLLASATSWLEGSSQYHIDKRPDYVLVPRRRQPGTVTMYFHPQRDPASRQALRFSGAGSRQEENLRRIVTSLAAPGPGGRSEIERTVQSLRSGLGRPRKAALVVNSYDQVSLVVDRIQAVNPRVAERTRGVLREMPDGLAARERYVLRGQVQALGPDPRVEVIVFPFAALGRGTNIVFTDEDADQGTGAIGSVYFLTRPHPSAADLGLVLSLLGRGTERLDNADLRSLALAEVWRVADQHRYQTYRQIARVLTRPMSASQLDNQTLTVFAANLLVPILQTIGRGTRNGADVEVYFVDAAWAPNSAKGEPETRRSSVLVAMRDVLQQCLATQRPEERAIYHALYGRFAEAFRDIEGVHYPDATAPAIEDDAFSPSPSGLEDEMDGWDPDDAPLEGFGFEDDQGDESEDD